MKLLRLAFPLLLVTSFLSAHAQMTTFTATSINKGTKPLDGTLCLTAVDGTHRQIQVTASDGSTFLSGYPFCSAIAVGIITDTLSVPDSLTDSAVGHLYAMVIYDAATHTSTTPIYIPGITGSTWSLSSYIPSYTAATTQAFTYTYGSGPATGACGAPALYSNLSNFSIYVCGTDGQWHTGSSSGSGAGAPGPSGTLSIASTTTGAPGTNAIVTNTGTSTAAVLHFTIPAGATGATGPQGPAGSGGSGSGSVGATGATGPQGVAGATGPQGPTGATGPAGSGGTASHVVYASTLAVTPAAGGITPGVSATGDVDNASALNAALALSTTAKLVIDEPLAVGSTLLIHSNQSIECTPGMGLIELPNMNAVLIANATAIATPSSCSATTSNGHVGYVVSNLCDHDIKVLGCTLNFNSIQSVTASDHKTGTNNLWVPGLQFLGVERLEISGNLTYDSPAYNFAVNNVDNYKVLNNTLTLPLTNGSVQTYFKNTDGVHVNGPATNILIAGNTITTGDDSIPLNADDGDCYQSLDANGPHVAYPGWKCGDIIHATIRDNTFFGSVEGIRLLSATARIDDINIYNTHGTVIENALQINPFFYTGTGNVGSVLVDGFDVVRSATQIEGGVFPSVNATIGVTGNVESLRLSNLNYHNAASTYPFFYAYSGTIGGLSINGLNVNNATGVQNTGAVLRTDNATNSLVATSINWVDAAGNTGYLFGGTVAPAVITVSSLAGAHSRLQSFATGLTNSVYGGDAFATSGTTYVSTVFNEGGSGAALNGTNPATTVSGHTWSDTGAWQYASGGGVTDAVSPAFATIDIGIATNYVVRANITNAAQAAGFQILFNYVSPTTYNVVDFGSFNSFVIVEVVGGASTVVASTSGAGCGTTDNQGPLSVAVVGTTVTAVAGGCSATGTLTLNTSATRVGISNHTGNASILLNSFSVASQ